MTLADVYGPDKFGLSLELYPPRTPVGEQALVRRVEAMMELRPDYFTCTYGAGGSTRDKTLQVLRGVTERHDVPVATHLTCVGATVEQLRQYLREAQAIGVQNVVALRGDPPEGENEFHQVEGGLRYANELVTLIRGEFPDMGIAVAGYPEVHQEASSAEADLAHLKRKVEAGADAVITQLFFDNDDFFRFRDRYEQAGVPAPLVPGLLPVTSLQQIQRITSMCGAKLPTGFIARLGFRNDPEWQLQVGVEHATVQAQGLIERGVPGIHFYVLNQARATRAVLRAVHLPRAI